MSVNFLFTYLFILDHNHMRLSMAKIGPNKDDKYFTRPHYKLSINRSDVHLRDKTSQSYGARNRWSLAL